jgi:GH25 family lysozyme M1 (1,4-beta-N-acetylmuramidase)
MSRASLVLPLAICACAAPDPDALSQEELAATVCGKGPTVKGIDVSVYQGTINWASAKADGVRYAFVRVSDGTTVPDTKFAANWAGTKAEGILRGAYQFFRPSQDAIAQADMLLDAVGGEVAEGDLPPGIDVESDGGLEPAQVTAKVKTWIERVKGATGRDPIIYTGFYFWRDQVGAPDITTSPLWHAQYTTAECPNIAPPWADWAFWQYTSTGAVAGISGNVDINRFNGTFDDLMQLAGPGAPPLACDPIGAEGGIVDDGDPCFRAGGPAASLRHIADAGEGSDLIWTYATEDADEANFAQWNLDLVEGGRYKVEVSTPAAFAHSKQARYLVTAGGKKWAAVIDQTAVDGWQTLGELDFAAGAGQSVHVGDNTGEPLADKVQLAFDSVRLTRVVPPGEEPPPGDGGGCNTGGASGLVIATALAGLRRRRRR